MDNKVEKGSPTVFSVPLMSGIIPASVGECIYSKDQFNNVKIALNIYKEDGSTFENWETVGVLPVGYIPLLSTVIPAIGTNDGVNGAQYSGAAIFISNSGGIEVMVSGPVYRFHSDGSFRA